MSNPMRPSTILALAATWVAAACAAPLAVDAPAPARLPNLVVILTDDQGFGDLGSQGATGFATPHLDRLASEGTRFTSFYSSQPVCTPSRAGLLTGVHPQRLGLGDRVVFPFSEHGLEPGAVTLAERLQAAGYATGIVGKWHLGHQPRHLPLEQGFDRWFGVPYSNDMDGHHYVGRGWTAPPLPLFDDRTVIEESPDQARLTERFTTAAIDFVRDAGERPFFLYLAHVMPHQPLAAGAEFDGTTAAGLYGDVIAELDASVGRLLDELDVRGSAGDTIVLFTSDNGPWRAESSGGLRGRKGQTFEGGMRVPCLLRWPGRVPAGRVSDRAWTMVDLVPTVVDLLGLEATGEELDGRSVGALWEGGDVPAAAIPYCRNERLEAVREGRWKLRLAQGDDRAQLFDLANDRAEAEDVADRWPAVVVRLEARGEELRRRLGTAFRTGDGAGARTGGGRP